MGQGAVWYTAQFYTQFFLERVMKVEPALVNLLILSVTVASAVLHIVFARLSDRIGRKPVMLFGLLLAAVSFVPGFQLLAGAVNPGLTEAIARAPVTVFAAPEDCSFQFDPIGRSKFSSSCDIAKSTLANLGVPYRNEAVEPDELARIRIGTATLSSIDGTVLATSALATAQKNFAAEVGATLAAAAIRRRRIRAASTSRWHSGCCWSSSSPRPRSTARRRPPWSSSSRRASAIRRCRCPIIWGSAGSAASCRPSPSPSWRRRAISMPASGIP